MPNWYMLTLVGRDQIGIVARLSKLLYASGAMLGEASMLRLGGNFTVMLMAHSEQSPDALAETLHTFTTELGLRLHIEPIDGELHHHQVPDVFITVHGADRAGIVAEVSEVLAAAGCNIVNLDSDVGGSAEKPFYIMQIEGVATQGEAALQQALAHLAARDDLDIRVAPIDAPVM